MSAYHLTLKFPIARPPREVVAWWTGFPDDYRADDPREQPHRIKVVGRAPGRIDVLTWFRTPWRIDTVISETILLRGDDGFSIDVHLPLGLRQHDEFLFLEKDGGTDATITLDLAAPTLLARIVRPLYWYLYGVRMYPRTFRTAGRLCERDAPRLT